jgi:two-component system, NarL family, response regulator LiaR
MIVILHTFPTPEAQHLSTKATQIARRAYNETITGFWQRVRAVKMPIRVMVVDDHRHVHEAVAAILGQSTEIMLVAQASNGEEGILLCRETLPDVVLMDVLMPGMDGVEATRIIREEFPLIKVLVLSSFQDHESIFAMLQSGASGYVVKGALVHDLISAIRTTYDGKAVFSPEVTLRLLDPGDAITPHDFNLTQREQEILLLMAEGLNNHEVAHKLTISNSTVKFHISNILNKLGASTRSEALVIAAKGSLI